jgi:hypothetical protein
LPKQISNQRIGRWIKAFVCNSCTLTASTRIGLALCPMNVPRNGHSCPTQRESSNEYLLKNRYGAGTGEAGANGVVIGKGALKTGAKVDELILLLASPIVGHKSKLKSESHYGVRFNNPTCEQICIAGPEPLSIHRKL